MEHEPDFPQLPDDFKGQAAELVKRARLRLRHLWRRLVPPVSMERRAEVQVQLREESKGDFSYYVLVLLSCAIATFGLLIDSAATIIGAMLVAPLMSPILGLGLASLRGDTALLRSAAWSLVRGAIAAILLSAFITWTNGKLPFISLHELPGEVLARTRPSPIDLGVALAGGLAAAFALVQPQLSAALPGVAIATALMPPLCVVGVGMALGDGSVAWGALLLFLTNAVTIAAAAIALFFAMGFDPPRREHEGRLPRSLLVSAALTMLLLAPLGFQSYRFVQAANESRRIEDVVKRYVESIPGTELVVFDTDQNGETLEMDITIRTVESLKYEDSVALQESIAGELQQTVKLKINQVFAAQLDPLVPPTPTYTSTPGPSPTYTPTVIPSTPTLTATATLTPTATDSPTLTPSLTPTPSIVILDNTFGQSVSLMQYPGGPSIGLLPPGSLLTVLYGRQIYEGWVWIEVIDEQGRQGWIPEFYTSLVTLTPTETLTTDSASATPTP